MTDLEQLKLLYAKQSKHSNYQVLPAQLASILGEDNFTTKSRSERERLHYFKELTSFGGKRVLDIGGNTGFFTFEALAAGAANVTYVEGNQAHAAFVTLAARVLNLSQRVTVSNRYFDFSPDTRGERYDLVLLLNVLHHLGDDFGDTALSIAAARKQIASMLNAMAGSCREMLFQLGFNWKGDRRTCLFEHGTKRELIDFVRTETRGQWFIEAIGVPELVNGKVQYVPLNDRNIERSDALGEFLNRPVFFLRSLAAG